MCDVTTCTPHFAAAGSTQPGWSASQCAGATCRWTRVCAGVFADKLLLERVSGPGARRKRAWGVAASTVITSSPGGGRAWPLRFVAGCVVACAGALHTPALLLRSGVTVNGNVGRNLRLHPATAVLGVYQKVRGALVPRAS